MELKEGIHKKGKGFFMTNIFNSRKFRFGTLSVILTVGVIAVVIALNIILSLLGQRFNLIFDLTKDKEYKLSEETVEFLEKVDQDIEIVVLNNEIGFKEANEYYNQAYLLITQFSQVNSKIKVKYVDMDRDPTFAQKYTDLDLEENGVLIIGPQKKKALAIGDLFSFEYDQYYQPYFSETNVEQAIASGIYAVTSELPLITILQGHDEASTAGLEKLLEQNNFEVKTINIAIEEIDKNSSVVVIPSPKRDYIAEELKKLDDYLKDKEKDEHNLVAIFGYDQPELPNLQTFIKEWGIEVRSELIYETNYVINNTYGFGFLPRYVENIFAKDLESRRRACAMLLSRALNTLYDDEPGPYGQKTEKVLTTTDGAKLTKTALDDDWEPSDKDEQGRFTLMAKSIRETVHDNKKYKNTAVVLGSKDFLGDSLLSNTGFANFEFALNMFNELSKRQSPITIKPKKISAEQMPATLTAKHIEIIGLYMFTILLPICVLGFGLVVWLRRRHL